MQSIAVKRLPHNLDLPLPTYETVGSAGMDLRAAITNSYVIAPSGRIAVPTGLAIAIPRGFVGQLCSRSGMALKNGVIVLIAPGIIDSDYRGELLVTLINLGTDPFIINRGDRIGQLLIMPVFQPQWHEVDELSETERGANGFGSTGL